MALAMRDRPRGVSFVLYFVSSTHSVFLALSSCGFVFSGCLC